MVNLHGMCLFTFPDEYHAYPQRRITGRNAHIHTFKLGRTQRRELDIQVLLSEGRQFGQGNGLRHDDL
jgi:hypothetical protein